MSISFSRNPKKVLNYVTECIDLIKKTKKGLQFEVINENEFENRIYVLGKLISMPSFSTNTSEKRYLIKSAISLIKDEICIDEETLIKCIEKVQKEHLNKRKRPITYYVAFHFPIQRKSFPKKHITIDGITFKIVTTRGFFRIFKREDIPKEEAQDLFGNLNYNHLIIYTQYEARDIYEAFNYVNSTFEIMRGLLNFSMMNRRRIYHYGQPRPISFIGHPNFYLIYSDQKKYLTHDYSLRETYLPILSISQNRLNYFNRLVKSYNNKKDNDLKRIFGTTVQLYISALDMVEKYYSFLHLWQVLEVVAIKDEVGFIKGKKMLKRIKAIFNNDPLTSDIIDALYEKRNKFVHGSIGNDEIEDEEIAQLRRIVHRSILFLFEHINSVESAIKMTYVYDNLPLMKKTLRDKREMIRYVEQIK